MNHAATRAKRLEWIGPPGNAAKRLEWIEPQCAKPKGLSVKRSSDALQHDAAVALAFAIRVICWDNCNFVKSFFFPNSDSL